MIWYMFVIVCWKNTRYMRVLHALCRKAWYWRFTSTWWMSKWAIALACFMQGWWGWEHRRRWIGFCPDLWKTSMARCITTDPLIAQYPIRIWSHQKRRKTPVPKTWVSETDEFGHHAFGKTGLRHIGSKNETHNFLRQICSRVLLDLCYGLVEIFSLWRNPRKKTPVNQMMMKMRICPRPLDSQAWIKESQYSALESIVIIWVYWIYYL